jgi:hypothetical protein
MFRHSQPFKTRSDPKPTFHAVKTPLPPKDSGKLSSPFDTLAAAHDDLGRSRYHWRPGPQTPPLCSPPLRNFHRSNPSPQQNNWHASHCRSRHLCHPKNWGKLSSPFDTLAAAEPLPIKNNRHPAVQSKRSKRMFKTKRLTRPSAVRRQSSTAQDINKSGRKQIL